LPLRVYNIKHRPSFSTEIFMTASFQAFVGRIGGSFFEFFPNILLQNGAQYMADTLSLHVKCAVHRIFR